VATKRRAVLVGKTISTQKRTYYFLSTEMLTMNGMNVSTTARIFSCNASSSSASRRSASLSKARNKKQTSLAMTMTRKQKNDDDSLRTNNNNNNNNNNNTIMVTINNNRTRMRQRAISSSSDSTPSSSGDDFNLPNERKRDLTAEEYVAPKIMTRSQNVEKKNADEGFNAARTSFGTVGLSVGLPLLIYGFGAYFSFLPGTEISALMLIYGFPISLIGFALKYAELLPLDCESFEDAIKAREEQSTAVLTQLRNDVTRYRYGDEQHLEEAMNIIFKFNRPGGLQKRQRPKLIGVCEQMVNDRYAIVLTFESPKITKEEWDTFMGKFAKFFGPNVDACAVEKTKGEIFEIILISNGGKDIGGPGEDMEVLPPLMPGLPARYQKRGTA